MRHAICQIDPQPDYQPGRFDSLQWCAGCHAWTPNERMAASGATLCRHCHAYRDEPTAY